MPTTNTTSVGSLLVNDSLPEDLRDDERVLDKKGVNSLLSQVAQKYPDRYTAISKRMTDLGRVSARETGFGAFGLKDLRSSPAAAKRLEMVRKEVAQALSEGRDDDIVGILARHQQPIQQEVLDESLKAGNPLAEQVRSGSRGNPAHLNALRGADLLYADFKGRPIPVPVTRSYSQGLTPAQHAAAAYGARAGVIHTKLNVASSGYASKQLARASHRLVVAPDPEDDGSGPLRGVPSTVDDPDNEGALLSRAAGGFPRNTVLTPRVLGELRRKGVEHLVVRSPIAGRAAEHGGVYAGDVGTREGGRTPDTGSLIGLTAAQALSEPLTQATLSSKHSGGVAGEASAVGGFDLINALLNPSQTMDQAATHAEVDGRVGKIEPAAAGGHFVVVDAKRHYVGPGREVTVKAGDTVEAGDPLSSGVPSTAQLVKYKGVGEGRRAFVELMRDAFKGAKITGHRRNLELLATGLIDHVKLTDELPGHAPGDIVSYRAIERNWEPRDGAEDFDVAGIPAGEWFLEEPVLHYTVGTRITPSVKKKLEDYGIEKIKVHGDPPPFEPHMVRAVDTLQHDPDWMTKMYGSHLQRSMLKAIHRGATSDEDGSSFVPGLARAVDFKRPQG